MTHVNILIDSAGCCHVADHRMKPSFGLCHRITDVPPTVDKDTVRNKVAWLVFTPAKGTPACSPVVVSWDKIKDLPMGGIVRY
jgi:hypothetical protein